MTLQKQLILIILSLFLIVFSGTFYISIQNSRAYLSSQLASHAQDAATSLGLSLSPHMQNEDIATMNSMVDAVFDRGDYRLINIRRMNGEALIERSVPVVIEQVPSWFVEIIHLETPAGEALLMSGWVQAATISVKSHPGYAYFELWQNAKQTFWLFLSTAFLICLLGITALRVLLKPLREVEEQAEAICSREYPIQATLPWTRELRSVVLAMNKMVMRIREMFQEQAEMTERLRKEVFNDSVTGMGNRKYFDQQLQNFMRTETASHQGALLLIQLNGLQSLNSQQGYEAGDALLKSAAQAINLACEPLGEHVAAHLSGADFAVFLGGLPPADAEHLAEKIQLQLMTLVDSGIEVSRDVAHIGIACFEGEVTIKTVLSLADSALRSAQADSPNAISLSVVADKERETNHGASEWRAILEAALSNSAVHLHFQRVEGANGEEEHEEVLARIRASDGTDFSAGLFVPMAERNKMAAHLDKVIVLLALERLKKEPTRNTLAINLSPSSLSNEPFKAWLYEVLSNDLGCTERIVFEVSEYGVLRDIEASRQFGAALNRLGAGFSIDHFGRGFSSFGYLQSMPVRYLKLDGSYTREINKKPDNRFFLQSLVKTAHSIDIKVIAEAVETCEEKETLLGLDVDSFQGYFIGRPHG